MSALLVGRVALDETDTLSAQHLAFARRATARLVHVDAELAHPDDPYAPGERTEHASP
ncbi:hypothetical protein [Sandaracinus amylolyticus]|uniref:hypothetical protein n=1 Tax=Sandaracinus amylolyticus TaxID=927083 RepID=UPI001F465E6D|nr:hypothetical protein [Sandaracinus amylolyticus]